MLGVEFREEWNVEIPNSEPELTEARSKFANLNRLAALLMKSGKPAFQFEFFTIIAMRNALETPPQKPGRHPPDFYVPAAATWIDIVGQEIFFWDYEFPHGPLEGDPGRGGPLWTGKRGFCNERWQLWNKRFEEISESDGFSTDSRQRAREAAVKMSLIDRGHNVE